MTRVRRRSAPELSKLQEHIESLQKAPWIGPARDWWPRYLFHCTDIRNVVSILSSGELLSRARAQDAGRLRKDIAAPDIIAQTNPDWHKYVRLYFRPRTPTQHNNEGFRPRGARERDAHCPVPVYLLFDAFSLLSRQDSFFTEGNLASNTIPKSNIADLADLPFQLIYHDSWFEEHEKQTIVHHRNAEVIIPQRLSLDAVQRIICRSQAEYQTLLNLLPLKTRQQWVHKIGVLPSLALFYAKWNFVEQVEMTDEQITFKFNSTSEAAGPFNAKCNIYQEIHGDVRRYRWANDAFQAGKAFTLSLLQLDDMHRYRTSLFLDDDLAFSGEYHGDSLPF